MRLNRDEIAALIPHAGSMVLLDSVVEWDEGRIVCLTTMHRDRANPLYVAGQLSSVCGIEFAAQAMAVHGALLKRRDRAIEDAENGAATPPRAGFLASVRSVDLHVARLDDVRSVLTIEAVREAGDGDRVLYRFDLRAGDASLVSGRAAVVLAMPDLEDAIAG
jgi:predicted hotdog family 3-hydroxylacyl-ACP dehydratase